MSEHVSRASGLIRSTGRGSFYKTPMPPTRSLTKRQRVQVKLLSAVLCINLDAEKERAVMHLSTLP